MPFSPRLMIVCMDGISRPALMNRLNEWLGSIGLSEYLPLFQEHAIDLSVVPDLV